MNKELPKNEASTFKDILVKIMVTKIFTVFIKHFPDILNDADITPVFKKDDKADKSNYRHISILPNFSKIFKKLIILKSYLVGFRKNHTTPHVILKTSETWNLMLNNGHKVEAIVINLSKAFDTLNHNLLL